MNSALGVVQGLVDSKNRLALGKQFHNHFCLTVRHSIVVFKKMQVIYSATVSWSSSESMLQQLLRKSVAPEYHQRTL